MTFGSFLAVRGFQRGKASQNVAVLSTDSSPIGWAALLQWAEQKVPTERLFISSWQHGSDVTEQVHREGLGVEPRFTATLAC